MLDAASIGWATGAALLGAAGLRAAWGTASLRERKRSREASAHRRHQEFDRDLASAMEWARASQPQLKAWPGTRQFRVERIVDESLDCRSFYLAPVDGRTLPRFAPGQHLTFHLPVEHGDRPVVRCYSLSDRPREEYFRVTIKRALPPLSHSDAPPGQGSNYFHDRVGEGTILDAEAPQGAFFLDPTDDFPVVFIGGGIGITPLVSMTAAIATARDPRRCYVFAGFRNDREHYFRAELAALANQSRQLQLDVSYSQPTPDDQLGRDYNHAGYVDIARLKEVLPSSNFRFYVCGPPGMMESLVPELVEWGVPREHVHFEAFGPASVRGMSPVDVEPCDVHFARSGRKLRWDGNQSSLLELAEREGVEIESGCRAGSCGQCRVMVSAGKVVHAKPPGVELVDGECLACIAAPAGEVILEA